MTTDPVPPRRGHNEDDAADWYGGRDPSLSLAHRVITPPLLAGLTGAELDVCQRFHHIFFCLLDWVGRVDGLIAAPPVWIGPNADRLAAAERWATDHPAPDIDALWAELDASDDVDAEVDAIRSILSRLSLHSLDLAMAVGSNTSATFGSVDAVVDEVVVAMREVEPSGDGASIGQLADLALALLGHVARHVRILGGAHVHYVPDEESKQPGVSGGQG